MEVDTDVLIDVNKVSIEDEMDTNAGNSNNSKGVVQFGEVNSNSNNSSSSSSGSGSGSGIMGGMVAQEERLLPVPPNRLSPLRASWKDLCIPICQQMKLQIRFNQKRRRIEIKTCEATEMVGALQKAADFLHAFLLGFSIEDAIALLRMDDIFVDSFEIDDVKRLHGEHLSRAIGRISGKDGKTKFTIENATRTRIVLADKHIHILGSFNNIKVARTAICNLILGSPPGKVYANLRHVAARLNERF